MGDGLSPPIHAFVFGGERGFGMLHGRPQTPAEDNRECFALPAGKGVQMVSGPI